jgi:citrate synthase
VYKNFDPRAKIIKNLNEVLPNLGSLVSSSHKKLEEAALRQVFQI